MNIGVALKYYRKLSKMTQVQVAEHAGVNEKYYGEIERGESSPTLERLEKISLSLGVSMQQLVGYSPLTQVTIELPRTMKIGEHEIHAYCNCCGTEFVVMHNNIVCPQCGCEYDEENEFIEVYGN